MLPFVRSFAIDNNHTPELELLSAPSVYAQLTLELQAQLARAKTTLAKSEIETLYSMLCVANLPLPPHVRNPKAKTIQLEITVPATPLLTGFRHGVRWFALFNASGAFLMTALTIGFLQPWLLPGLLFATWVLTRYYGQQRLDYALLLWWQDVLFWRTGLYQSVVTWTWWRLFQGIGIVVLLLSNAIAQGVFTSHFTHLVLLELGLALPALSMLYGISVTILCVGAIWPAAVDYLQYSLYTVQLQSHEMATPLTGIKMTGAGEELTFFESVQLSPVHTAQSHPDHSELAQLTGAARTGQRTRLSG